MTYAAQANTSTYIQGVVDYSAYTSNGSIKVDVTFKMRRTNNYSGTTYSTTAIPRICISGDPANFGYSGSAGINVYGGQQNTWQTIYSASRTFDASRSGNTIYVGWKVDNDNSGYLAGSATAAITLPTAYTAPSTPTVSASNSSASANSVSYGTSSFGTPSSGTVYLYGGTSASPTSQITSKTTTGSSSYSHSSLSSNTKYYYRARAYNGQLYSSYSSDASAITRPANPSSVSLSVTGETTATLTIKAPSMGSAATVTAYYKLNSGSAVSAGTITSGGTITKSLTGLTAGTTYTATAYLSNSSGSSGSVTSNSITTYKAPYGQSMSVTATTADSVTVSGSITSYGVPSDSSNRHLVIGIAQTSGDGSVIREYGLGAVTSGSATLTNSSTYSSHSPLTISPNTNYYPYVWATNGILGSYGWSGTALTKPATPSAASLTVTDTTTATLSVTVPSMGTASTLTVYYKLNSGSYTSGGTITQGSSKNISLTGLTPGTTYTATVKITNGSGDSGTITTNSITTYKFPQGLSATLVDRYSNGAKFTVSVSDYGVPANANGRWLQSVISLNDTIGSEDWWSAHKDNVSSATITQTGTTIQPNTKYYYGVYAYNTVKSSSAVIGRFTTRPELPTYVADSLEYNSDSCRFKVTLPADGGALPKTVRYSLDNGSTYISSNTTVVNGDSTTRTVNITGLNPNTTYNIKVDVYTDIAASGYITVPQFKTMKAAYCSNGSTSKRIKKAYISASSKARFVNKIYSSVNGQAKLVYKAGYGRNILQDKLNTRPSTVTSHGITFTLNTNGSITVNGTNDGDGNSVVWLTNQDYPCALTSGKYCMSVRNADGSLCRVSPNIVMWNGTSYVQSNNTQPVTTSGSNEQRVYFQVHNGDTTTYNNEVFWPQIEKGDGITPWQQYY